MKSMILISLMLLIPSLAQAQLNVSGGVVPLPTNAAQETSGNLASLAATVGTKGAVMPSTAIVIAGITLAGSTMPQALDQRGIVFVQPIPTTLFPLPPCNPIRKINCSK